MPVNGRWRGCLLEILETLVLTAVIFFVLQHFVAQPYQILQVSMENSLQPGQNVLVDKLSPLWSDYKRGDVIVFEPPGNIEEDDQNIPFIKRIIGVPGDQVQIKDNGVYVNGVRLIEPYVYEGQATTPTTNTSSWVIPAGEYFVMGDHRQASIDSRAFGPIPRSSIIGRAWLRYWPLGSLEWVEPATYPGVPDSPPGPPPPDSSPAPSAASAP